MTVNYKKIDYCILSVLLVLFCNTGTVTGQSHEAKILTEKDYHLWGRLSMGQMDMKGSWMSWRMSYDDGRELFYVGMTSGNSKPMVFTEVEKDDFVRHNKFAYLDKRGIFNLVDLVKGTRWEKASVIYYECLNSYDLLLLQSTIKDGLSNIEIIDSSGNKKMTIYNVKSWISNPKKNLVALIVKDGDSSSCMVLQLHDLSLKKVEASNNGEFERPVWDRTGRFIALALASRNNDKDQIYSYDTATNKLTISNCVVFPDGRRISSGAYTGLSINENGEGVFFNTILKKNHNEKNNQLVEVWNSSDKIIYPSQQIIDSSPETLLAYWNVTTNEFSLIADPDTPSASLTGKKNFAIVWDRLAYEPQFDRDGPVDFFLIDIKHGLKKKWLAKRALNSVFPIIASNKILYRDGNWKLFDPEKNTVLDLDIAIDKPNSERLAWNLNPVSDMTGTWLILHDGFDLWKINMLTGQKTRLTQGREKGIVYMLPEKSAKSIDDYDMLFLPSLDLSGALALKLRNHNESSTGYCILQADGKIKDMVFEKLGHTSIVTNGDKTCFGFICESFDNPSSIKTFSKGKIIEIFKSNPHQKEYKWGKAELVEYKAGNCELKGILYCPDNIDKNKKYPLITHIYEIQSDRLFHAQLPGFMNMTGFNIANFVAKGYFVLLPDIHYGLGNPGKDAAISVNAALDEVISVYPIDVTKLGIIGHSFGGYETAAIVSYTNRFCAAVMGAGISNAISSYLTVNRNSLKADYWRYEYGQSRIGKSLFEDKQSYLDSSPVLNADKIETPLLIWTGGKDEQVKPDQSYSMHLALRRLKKQSSLLVYPDEGHAFVTPEANKDLTQRIQQWFDCFLKGFQTDWIK
jgi:dipeptidyl aminopeptidase/acylaminoacyl peptidase